MVISNGNIDRLKNIICLIVDDFMICIEKKRLTFEIKHLTKMDSLQLK